MRARKLIKRARFKHPTSSSTLIVGNDYDEDDIKKNLIREATFKMVRLYSLVTSTVHRSYFLFCCSQANLIQTSKNQCLRALTCQILDCLHKCGKSWEKMNFAIMAVCRYVVASVPFVAATLRGDHVVMLLQPWTRQEIHNLLHGAHTFANSWRRIARHYEYQLMHRDWQSVKAKLKTLQNYGLLSSNLKVCQWVRKCFLFKSPVVSKQLQL